MRRSRRGGHHTGLEFGGSGEDSFVAVVVTKLTGALLFILLLTMVIMALLPKAVDLPGSPPSNPGDAPPPLVINTPGDLPEAIAGRPYNLALAATGGRGTLRWSVDGKLPDGLSLDPESGLIHGTPRVGTPEPAPLNLRVTDGSDRSSRGTHLVVYQPDSPLTVPSRWRPSLPPIPWREWVDQGFGFLVLILIHLVGMNTLAALERRATWRVESATDAEEIPATTADLVATTGRRFARYRGLLRTITLLAGGGLGFWLVRFRG